MAEQKITVRLDPMQVNDLKQFVRDEIEKERRASMRVAPDPGGLRTRVEALRASTERTYELDDMIRADIVLGWLDGLLK